MAQMAHAGGLYYRVRPRDQLGKILYSMKIGPLWGKGRYVDQTTRLNGLPCGSDMLSVGTVLFLPVSQLPEGIDYIVLADGEVRSLSDGLAAEPPGSGHRSAS